MSRSLQPRETPQVEDIAWRYEPRLFSFAATSRSRECTARKLEAACWRWRKRTLRMPLPICHPAFVRPVTGKEIWVTLCVPNLPRAEAMTGPVRTPNPRRLTGTLRFVRAVLCASVPLWVVFEIYNKYFGE